MNKNSKIYIAGHKGMVGSAIWRNLEKNGYTQLIGKTSKELDLRNQSAVNEFFEETKPDIVIDAAARVGGILANSEYPYNFLMENLQIQNNLIDAAHKHDAQKFIYLGSSCIYPKLAPQPLKEEYLLTDSLEPTNEWYAIAKIAGVKACEAIRKQFGKDFVSLMPTNLYGQNDNFDLKTSHVLPAMIRKFHEAKSQQSTANDQQSTANSQKSTVNDQQSTAKSQKSTANSQKSTANSQQSTAKSQQSTANSQKSTAKSQKSTAKSQKSTANSQKSTANSQQSKVNSQKSTANNQQSTANSQQPTVTLWGSGTPLREFLHVDDLAEAVTFALENKLEEHLYNIGTGKDITIKELAEMIQRIVGHTGEIIWDSTKPDGTPRKLMDVSKMKEEGWKAKIALEEGIKETYEWFLENEGKFKEVKIDEENR